ncbi:cytochrome c-type biogenesis protein [Bordetella sp. BOR01]|uniref:cytochrome c-type biogenesis protein n=1 Tax=Bordetella sp. BOR01 TaxID=2854779 RepID=UPI001C441C6C|nr:cytochrome c-type biogenesis protein [Bordetella sp. BOR01]MBV7483591.1 cytochrome c-type biogenesis protein CcmH [Bordetella sp. BOR01]
MKHFLALVMLGCALLGTAWSAIDTYEFDNEAQRARYRHLAEVLRCPKCQNQNIADSNSPIANDLRGEIHRMLGEGQTNEQIIGFMVARYGDFVLYKPPLDARTMLLWLGPAALLLAGAAVLASIVMRGRRARLATGVLSDAERLRLAELLHAVGSGKDTP